MTFPIIEAHRGDSARAPENTLAAFRAAIAAGAPSIELDTHPAADGTLVVIHDATVDRTTGGTGAVSSLSLEALRRLDAGAIRGPEFAGEKIPLLAEVFELLAPTAVRLNIEIKASPPGRNVPAALMALLERFGKRREYVVSSFDLQALLQVRALAPDVALALIGNGPDILPAARQHRLPWIHPYHKTADAALMAAAHGAGLRVNVWTVDDPADYPRWAALGVDKLCTNRPADLLKAQNRFLDIGSGDPVKAAGPRGIPERPEPRPAG